MSKKMTWEETGYTLIQVSPKDLSPNDYNPNRMSDEVFAKEIRSIEKNGFIDPVKVRQLEDGSLEIVDGEHRWRASMKLGLKSIPAINLGPIPDEQAKKLTIIANELRGAPEPVLLAALLKDLNESISIDQLAAELPMSSAEIDALVRSASTFDWDSVNSNLGTSVDSTDSDEEASAPVPQVTMGADKKFLLGGTKGSLSARLSNALEVEFQRSAAAVGTTNLELVARHVLGRLRETVEKTDQEASEAAKAAPQPAKKKGRKSA